MKTKALLSSVLTIVLCLSLIAGSSFALFTSESKVNVAVTSGTVKVVATVEDLTLETTLAENLSETSATESENIITLDKIVPGDYVTFNIRINNASDVAVQYRTIIEKVADNGLWDGLVVTIDDVEYEGNNAVKTEWTAMEVGCDDIIVSVKVALPEEAGNEYQHTSCKFAYTVEAVQGNADMPSEWDGQTVTDLTADAAGVYHITNAAEFVAYMNSVNRNDGKEYYNVVLDRDIDLGGHTYEVSGTAAHFSGSFDGQNHTVSNYIIKRDGTNAYTGLFSFSGWSEGGRSTSFKNLTVKNGTVISNGPQVSAIVPSLNEGGDQIVENCHAIDCVVIGEKKVGAIVGYNCQATVKDCSATNCRMYASDDHANQVTVYGYDNSGTFTNNAEPVNCTLQSGMNGYVGGNVTITASENIGYVANATVTVANGEGNYHRIYSDHATFVNCVFEGEGNHWIGDAATFIDCTFNVVIDNAEPKIGTITFENCTFNKNVHFASADGRDTSAGKFFAAENCRFQANLTVSNFEKVTLTDCSFSGNNWARKNMISYCPLVIDNCTFTTGIRLSYSDTSRVTCTNGTVDLSWTGGSATVGSN